MAENEKVVIKRGAKLIELVVRDRLITNEDFKNGISGAELKERMHKRIDKIFKG